MTKKMWIFLLIGCIIVLTMASCERPASKAPVPEATSSGDLPFPLPTSDNAMKVILTQTAIARNITNPVAAVPTNTPPVAVQPADTEAPPPTPEPPQATATLASTAVPVPPATPGHPATYTLQDGEHPYCIARRFNVDPGELLSINGLGANPLLDPGTEIKIPTTGSTWSVGERSLLAHPSTWTVDPGDTIYYIACQYGDVDPNAIAIANGLQSPFSLTVGQVLHIP